MTAVAEDAKKDRPIVWAMVTPLEFGPCFPSGHYLEDDERTEAYFRANATAEELAEVDALGEGGYRHRVVVHTQYVESRKFSNDEGPVDPAMQPRVFQMERGSTNLGSWLEVTNRLLMVDEALRTIIERFEPGVHQFWPMEVRGPDGEPLDRQFHALVIRQSRDSLIDEQSDLQRLDQDMDERQPRFAKNTDAAGLRRVTLRGAAIEGVHLWREHRLATPNILVSDALRTAIKEAKLRVFRHGRLNVV